MIYTSIKNDKIKEIKKLNQKKYRDESNLFLIEGEHLIKESYKSNLLKEVILEEGSKLDLNININYVSNASKDVMKYITELDTPCKAIGICNRLKEKDLGNKILILDDIQDPGNLGTIIRSCVAFNIDTIVLSKHCVDLYNSKVIRATQGMIFNINIIRRDLYDFINKIKNDYKIYGTKVDGGKSIKDIEKEKKFAIIMGNEGNGVSDSLLSLCSEYIYIDMNASCESLNVAVATSIILYELNK